MIKGEFKSEGRQGFFADFLKKEKMDLKIGIFPPANKFGKAAPEKSMVFQERCTVSSLKNLKLEKSLFAGIYLDDP